MPKLGYTYRQYRHATADREPDESHRQWWAQRIPDLPDPPKLPPPIGAPDDPRRSTRRWHWLDPDTRDALFGQARAHGVTPAMTLAASFSHTLASWSDAPRFLLNVPLFGREPLHDDVDRLVGDFTSSLLLDVDLSQASTGAQRAHALQDAMRTAAAHADYPGLAVLRDLVGIAARRCWRRWCSPVRWDSGSCSPTRSPVRSAPRSGSSPRARKCC